MSESSIQAACCSRRAQQVHHLDEDGDYSLDLEAITRHDMREEGLSQVSSTIVACGAVVQLRLGHVYTPPYLV
eukprot:1149325-Pelagomonas_calceolata.AAC.9